MNRWAWLLLICLSEMDPVIAKKTDSTTSDYRQAVDLCLFHRFDEAENLLKRIIRHTDHPNREAARFQLLEEIYFRRSQYKAYTHFCDSTGQPGSNSAIARFLVSRPAPQFTLMGDSIQIPIRVRKWPFVNVTVNGRLCRFIVDTGAERTILSKRLANELKLTDLFNTSLRNVLNQSVSSVLSQIDTLCIGTLTISNLPIWQIAKTGFPADGLLGWDVLQNFLFTIDFASEQLVLKKPIARSGVYRNLLGIGRPMVTCYSKTEHQLMLFLDTGSDEGVSLTPNGLTKIGSHRTKRRLRFQEGLGGRFRISWGKSVKHATISIDKKLINLKKTPVEHTDETISSVIKDGSVGSKQFRKGRLTVDYLNNHFDYDE